MKTRAFVAQRPVDNHEIGRLPDGRDLSRRRDTDEKAATTRKQFFGDKNGKRCANRAAEYPDVLAAK